MPNRIFIWPGQLPSELDGLHASLTAALGGTEIIRLESLEDLASSRDGEHADDALLVVQVDTWLSPALGASLAAPQLNSVVIVSDEFLGTDLPDFDPAAAAGAAVAAVRSLAVQRGSSSRANAVCVPAAMFGKVSALRGPLATKVELLDVVEAVVFFLSEENAYLNGQLLFVNGGRHLFSSFTA
ncbi:MAG: hypothetical protein ACRDZM_07920 [Acidimicrobiia bacterium]